MLKNLIKITIPLIFISMAAWHIYTQGIIMFFVVILGSLIGVGLGRLFEWAVKDGK